MITESLIHYPPHYVQGRTIEPITVIETWGLCHHLACVVKYIARAGRKTSHLEDLKKAEWYLTRELHRHQKGFNKCHFALIDPSSITPDAILADWDLSPRLEDVLLYLESTRNTAVKRETLQKALHCLQAEITHPERTPR